MSDNRTLTTIDLDRRRLAVISVRTTGFDPGYDHIVEIGVVIRKAYAADRTYHRLVDPAMPILPMATEVHGMTNADVAGAPYFEEIAAGLARFIGAADLAGYGIRELAIPILDAEFRRVHVDFQWFSRSVVDLRDIYLRHQPHHLRAAVGHYLKTDLPGAASSLGEAEASSRVLDAQLQSDEDLPRTAWGLQNYPRPRDQVGLFQKESEFRTDVFGEGRHRGRTPSEVGQIDPHYLESLLRPGLLLPARMLIEDVLVSAAFDSLPKKPLI